MHAATQKLIAEQMIHPQMIDTGPPLPYPIPKEAAQQTLSPHAPAAGATGGVM